MQNLLLLKPIFQSSKPPHFYTLFAGVVLKAATCDVSVICECFTRHYVLQTAHVAFTLGCVAPHDWISTIFAPCSQTFDFNLISFRSLFTLSHFVEAGVQEWGRPRDGQPKSVNQLFDQRGKWKVWKFRICKQTDHFFFLIDSLIEICSWSRKIIRRWRGEWSKVKCRSYY